MLELEHLDQGHDRLAYWLPWGEMIAKGVILNKDNSVGMAIEFRPPDLDARTLADVSRNVRRFAVMLSQMSSRYVAHLDVLHDDMTAWEEGRQYRDPALALIDNEARAEFTTPNAYFDDRFFISVTFIPKDRHVQRMERLLLTNAPKKKIEDFLTEMAAPLIKTVRVMAKIMGDFCAFANILDDDGMVTYLNHCAGPNRRRIRHPRKPEMMQDDGSVEPEKIYYGFPLENVALDTPWVAGSHPKWESYPHDYDVRVVRIHGMCPGTYPGILDELKYLNFPYRYTQRFICLSHLHAMELWKKIFSLRKNNTTSLTDALLHHMLPGKFRIEEDPAAVADAMEAADQVKEQNKEQLRAGYLTTTVTVWDWTPEHGGDVTARVEAVIEKIAAREFGTTVETYNSFLGLLGSMPFEHRANARKLPLPAIHMLDMAPSYAPWLGPAKNHRWDTAPLLKVRRGVGAFNLDLHSKKNSATLLSGEAGSGKSSLLARLVAAWRGFGGPVGILDVHGFRSANVPAVLAFGGDVLSFSRGDLALQPLADIGADDPGGDDEFITQFRHLLGMLRVQGITFAEDPESYLREELRKALENLSQMPRHHRTMDNLMRHLPTDELRNGFALYAGDGAYGPHLGAKKDRIALSDISLFEVGQLMRDPLAAPVIAALVHKIRRRMETRARSLLAFDEAWLALQYMPEDIDALLRDGRKFDLTVMLLVHNLDDICDERVKASIQSLTANWLMGANGAADAMGEVAETLRRWNFSHQERKLIANAANLGPGNFYFKCSKGSGMIQVDMPPIARAFCAAGGTEEDESAIHRILALPGGKQNFAYHWLIHKANQMARSDSFSSDVLFRQAAIMQREMQNHVQAAE